MKNYIDFEGEKILAVIDTTNPNLVTDGYISIEDESLMSQIREHTNYFKVLDGEVVKKSQKEIDQIEKEFDQMFKNNPLNRIKELEDQLLEIKELLKK